MVNYWTNNLKKAIKHVHLLLSIRNMCIALPEHLMHHTTLSLVEMVMTNVTFGVLDPELKKKKRAKTSQVLNKIILSMNVVK